MLEGTHTQRQSGALPEPGVHLVVRDVDVRWYLPLHRSNSCDVWLLAWERGQDTDWHDHGGSSGSLAVAEGSLVEQYRVPSGRRLGSRRLTTGEATAFGPGHVHDVAHGGDRSATSIHAYSPPLVAMTYYTATGYGLIARETVSIDGPEGARGRGGADTALANATASAAELASDALPVGAPGIDELLAEARSGLRRLRPEAALAAHHRWRRAGRHQAAGAADRRGRGARGDHHRPQRARVAARSPQRGQDPRPGPGRRAGHRYVLGGLCLHARRGQPAQDRPARGN